MTRSAFRLLLPLVLLLLALASSAGAATRPPSDGQLRAVAGKLLPVSSVLTDVSSDYQLSQGTRTVVAEFRPEDRGGAAAISRATYDPADPLPLNGLVLQATRSAGGVLSYNMTAVSESQKRFYIRGQIAGGRQSYLQLLSLTWGELTAESPEVEAWFAGLQFSDNAFRVPAGSVLYPAGDNRIRYLAGLLVVYKAYSYCVKITKPAITGLSGIMLKFRKRCRSMLDSKTAALINLAFPAEQATAINGALRGCSVLAVRRAWRRATGFNAPPLILRIHFALRPSGC